MPVLSEVSGHFSQGKTIRNLPQIPPPAPILCRSRAREYNSDSIILLCEGEMTEEKKGFWAAIASLTIWGLYPLYFSRLTFASDYVIVCWRLLWTVIFLALFIAVGRKTGKLIEIFRSPKTSLALLLSGSLMFSCWYCYIAGVTRGMYLDLSMSLYLNPVMNMVFGVVFLHERFSRAGKVAAALCLLALVILFAMSGTLPTLALVMSALWGLYTLVRKIVKVSAIAGLMAENIIFIPVAVFILFFTDGEHFTNPLATPKEWVMLMIAGFITVVPMILYTYGARRVKLVTLGFIQYIEPSMGFIIACLFLGDTPSVAKMIAFIIIWTALAILSAESLMEKKTGHLMRQRKDRKGFIS